MRRLTLAPSHLPGTSILHRIGPSRPRPGVPLSPMIWMCLDLGERRIGVAFSDSDELIAQPHSTLRAGRDGRLPLEELRRLAVDRQVGGVVVGLPVRLDGTVGPEAEAARARAAELRAALDLPVTTWDERLSSVEAERLLLEAGVRRRRRREITDRVAAAVILQGFLDHRRSQGGEAADVGDLARPSGRGAS